MKLISLATFAILSTITFSFPINLQGSIGKGAAGLIDSASGAAGNAASLSENAIIHPPQHPPQGSVNDLSPPHRAPVRLPLDTQRLIFDFADISMTFDQAQKMHIGNDLAIQYHDPELDGYDILRKWLRMKDSPEKDKIRELMKFNPKLKEAMKPSVKNLMRAIKKGNLNKVKYLMAVGVKPKESILRYAVLHSNPEIIKVFLESGVKRDALLFHAIQVGNTENFKEIFNAFIKGGGKLDSWNLLDAMLSENSEKFYAILHALIKQGFKPEGKHLEFAIIHSDPEIFNKIFKDLLEAKFQPEGIHLEQSINRGNPEIFNKIFDTLLEAGFKPDGNHLKSAILKGSPEIVNAFINGGVKPARNHLDYAMSSGNNPEIFHEIFNAFIKEGVPDRGHLRSAVVSGNPEFVNTLIDGGVKPEEEDLRLVIQYGNADSFKKNEIFNKIFKAFVQGGGKPDRKLLENAIGHGNPEIFSNIFTAFKKEGGYLEEGYLKDTIRLAHTDMVKALLKEGLKPDRTDLDYAMQYGNPGIIHEIFNSFIDGGGIPSKSQFEYSIKFGNPEIFNKILDAFKKGQSNLSADHLSTAIRFDKVDVVKALIKAGIDPNHAIKSGDLSLIEYLITKTGFNPTQFTLNEAIKGNNLPVIKYLVETIGLYPSSLNFNEAALQHDPQLVEYFQNLARQEIGNTAPTA